MMIMIWIFPGRYIPDFYDSHDVDHVCLLEVSVCGTALAHMFAG